VLEDRMDKHPYAVSPDGVTLVYTRSQESGTGRDLWLLPLASDENPSPLLESANVETNAAISPDGQWLAYQSNESGQAEIYVQAFPSAGRRQQISTAGGSGPAWAPSGVELFYRNANQMLAVEIETEKGLRAGRPRVLFEKEFESTSNNRNYDISLDGERFVMVQTPDSTERGQLEIVFNWFEELERLVPTEK
jgi:Tol biopolymer transport system component